MKTTGIKKALCFIAAFCIAAIPCFNYPAYSANEEGGSSLDAVSPEDGKFMRDALKDLPKTNGEDSFVIPPERVVDEKGNFLKAVSDNGYTDDPVVMLNKDCGTVSFSFEIKSAGLYYFSTEYRVTSGNSDAVRNMLIDGVSPYIETDNVIFCRMWRDSGEPTVNTLGNEVLPAIEELSVYTAVDICDGYGYYATPLIFYLDVGRHTVSFEYVSQDMAIKYLELSPYRELPSYREAAKSYADKESGEGVLTFQAEDSMIMRNSASIRLDSHGDPSVLPNKYGYKVYNAIGGESWRKGNQSVTLRFNVNTSGLYKLALRGGQIWDDGMPSYRTVMIDGEIPFAELMEYRFDYSARFKTFILSDSDDNPYLFYLEAGEHTLTLTVTLGEMTDIIQSMYKDMLILSDAILDITKLTGNDPDPNYDYQFFKNIPDLETNLKTLANDVKAQYENMVSVCGGSTGMASNLVSVYKQLESMIEDPFTIASRYSQLTSAQSSLGSWYMELQYQSLGLDEFSVAAENETVPERSSNFFQRFWQTAVNFMLSFTKDYNNVGSILESDTEYTDSIDVWISRGTEWAESLKELADSSFTPKTGISVNVKTVPASQLNTGSANVLLLSIISGDAPDIAMGISANSPVEFAIRNAVVDLSQMEDFNSVKERFLPTIFTPLTYNGGVYALPETMNFTVMFYRRDIIERYGISLPSTWDELRHKVLPELFKNGMSFYMPADFAMFLYQHKGSYYSDDGLRSALDSPEAYEAFEEYTQMFTQYGIDVNANFFNRFRTGEIPMGIGSYTLYLQLLTSAPELVGKWGIEVVPGTESNGETDRSVGGISGECDMIIKKDGVTDYSSSWKFLNWWTTAEVQRVYAIQIESLIGSESRWNSANLDAFLSLDWSASHVQVFEKMWNWAKETPVVLGSYYTSRYITNAFTNVVVSGNTSTRDALENAVKAINKELKTKQEEYGVYAN